MFLFLPFFPVSYCLFVHFFQFILKILLQEFGTDCLGLVIPDDQDDQDDQDDEDEQDDQYGQDGQDVTDNQMIKIIKIIKLIKMINRKI